MCSLSTTALFISWPLVGVSFPEMGPAGWGEMKGFCFYICTSFSHEVYSSSNPLLASVTILNYSSSLLRVSVSITLSRPSSLSPSAFCPHPSAPLSPSLPRSSCSLTITQTEASVSAVFLAALEDPPHNQTGAMLILPSPSPDWTSPGQTNTEYVSYLWTNWLTEPAPLACNGQSKREELSTYWTHTYMHMEMLGGHNPYMPENIF